MSRRVHAFTIYSLVGAISYLPVVWSFDTSYFSYDIHLTKREHAYLLLPFSGLIFGLLAAAYREDVLGDLHGARFSVIAFMANHFLVLLAAVIIDLTFYAGASFAPRPNDSALLTFCFMYLFSLILLLPFAAITAIVGAMAGRWYEKAVRSNRLPPVAE